jgi:hypothetical protein
VTHVRNALASLRAATLVLPRATANLPERSASAIALDMLGAAEVAPAQPVQAVLDAVRKRLVTAFGKPGGEAPARGDLRNGSWLLWADQEPLANLRGLLDSIWTEATRSNATRRNLVEAWLRGFSPDAPRVAEAGLGIRSLLASNPTARTRFWENADQRIELFNAKEGPKRLATWLVLGPEPVHHILSETGFGDPLRAVGGYMRMVQREMLALSTESLRKQPALDTIARLTAFLAPQDSLRFSEPESRGEIARGLLAPWLDGGREPLDPVRDSVRTFLLQKLADPRLRPQNWTAAGEEATNLMRRWLARASLKAFFDLIADHALDAHWKYREAFWSACLNKGRIDDAWLALGSQVHASARAVRELDGAYARLEGAGVAGNQSILILKVKNIVFCEWSHNGKLRAWPDDWKSAPRLNQKIYAREDVTQKGLPFPPSLRFGSKGAPDGFGLSHIGSDRNYWQSSAADLLARRANVHLIPTDWLPR